MITIQQPTTGRAPVPPRTAQGTMAFDRATGKFTAKAPYPPVKSTVSAAPVSLDTILLPHARSRWMVPQAAMMTPARIEHILRSACTTESPANEHALYDLMEATWPRLLKAMQEVKNAVMGLEWNIMDADEEDHVPGARELIERAMNGMKGDPFTDGQGWRATLSSLLDARLRGVSVCEIVWEYRGGKKFPAAWLPRMTRDTHARHFGWRAEDGRLVLYPEVMTQAGVEFPVNKFLVGVCKAGKGHPSGTALLRCLAWWWVSMNFSAEWLLNFAQIFGQPFRWATYDSSQEGVKDDLATMMEQMGSAAYGIGPDGTKVEWHESSKSGADNPQAYILKLADEACDLLVLGQTLTSSVGDSGSRALGEVHENVRADIIDSAAEWLAEVLNEQLVTSIIAINYGDLDEDAALPWFAPARKNKKDIKATAETIKVVLESGIPLKKEEVYDSLDMVMPAEGDAVFTNPLATIAPPPVGGDMADAAPAIRRVLAKLPIDAREYFMARLIEVPSDQ